MRTPETGEQRIIEKFLLIPRHLNGEWRWLERAKIIQEWKPAAPAWFIMSADDTPGASRWTNKSWA